MISERMIMKTYTVFGHKPITETIIAESAKRAALDFKEKHGFSPAFAESMEDAECAETYDTCESCGLPIFTDDNYECDSEGIYVHANCKATA